MSYRIFLGGSSLHTTLTLIQPKTNAYVPKRKCSTMANGITRTYEPNRYVGVRVVCTPALSESLATCATTEQANRIMSLT